MQSSHLIISKKCYLFFQYDSQNCTLLIRFRELNTFKYDSQNWTLFWIRLKELNPFFFEIRLKELNLLFFFEYVWLKELFSQKKKTEGLISFWKYDSKNWTLFENMTQRIEHFFENTTQRSEHFLFQYDSKNWTFFFSMTQRIEHFLIRLKELNSFFRIWLKELNLFFKNKTQRIEPSFLHDSKNWAFFLKYDLQELNLLKIRLKELALFFSVTQWIEPLVFQYDSKKWFFWRHRTELFFSKKKNDSKNWTFWMRLKEFNLLNTIHRVEPFLIRLKRSNSFFQIWLKELNFFWKKESIHKKNFLKELFSMTQKI